MEDNNLNNCCCCQFELMTGGQQRSVSLRHAGDVGKATFSTRCMCGNVKKLRVVTIKWGNSATVFVMEMRHVFCEPGTEYTTIDYMNEY